MPVTFNLVAHSARTVDPVLLTGSDTLKRAASDFISDNPNLVLASSSFGNAPIAQGQWQVPQNGLLDSVLLAYSKHHALVLRPDDIWLAIMVQFSFFVNKHSEQLRGRFVAHTGRKHIQLEVSHSEIFDAAALAPMFAAEMKKHISDTTLHNWVLPDFTTTTDNDRIVGSMVLMGAMKNLFSFGASVDCGIPRVTLLGTKQDWEEILRRVDRIAEFQDECVLWHRLLVPTISYFVRTYDDPTLSTPQVRAFWESMVMRTAISSGEPAISGWMTAFTMFSSEGSLLPMTHYDETLFDGLKFGRVAICDIPAGYVSVDIQLMKTLESKLLAGVVGTQVSSSADSRPSGTGQNDTVAPMVSFWFLVPRSDSAQFDDIREQLEHEREAKIADEANLRLSKLREMVASKPNGALSRARSRLSRVFDMSTFKR